MRPAIFELFLMKTGLTDLIDYRSPRLDKRETIFHEEKNPFFTFYRNDDVGLGGAEVDMRISISSAEYGPLSESEALFIRDIAAISHGRAVDAVLTYEFGVLDLARELIGPDGWADDVRQAFVRDLKAAISLLEG